MLRKICVVTGTRAEYGLLRPVMTLLKSDPKLEFQLVVTGSHLSPRHGETVRQIERDGFSPDERVQVDLTNDSKLGIALAMADTTSKIAEAFSRLAPDVVVVLGDRYEILACAQAALILGIPIAHIHGGEITAGAFDDSIRHAITKMSSFHFVAAQDYARRVVQLGEQPNTVFNVGALGVDLVLTTELVDRQELCESLQIQLTNPILLVTYHPTTRTDKSASEEITEVLAALEKFAHCTMIFTGVNADPGNSEIFSAITKFVAADPKKRSLHDSLGQKNYLNLMRLCDVVVGNSSSGIIEAPAFRVPTVNIGARQRGRLRADSIIDANVDRNQIQTSIEIALSSTWRERCAKTVSLYGSGDCAQNIVNILKIADISDHKIFFDLS